MGQPPSTVAVCAEVRVFLREPATVVVTCWIALERAVGVPPMMPAVCATETTAVWTVQELRTVLRPTIHAESATEATAVWTVQVRRMVQRAMMSVAYATAQEFPRAPVIALETRWTAQERVVEEPPSMPVSIVD